MRAFSRFDAEKELSCRIDGERDFVTLYNISSGGCMLETHSAHAEVGTRISINLTEMSEVQGTIVWKVGKNAGVRFDALIHQRMLEAAGFASSSEAFDEYDPRDRFGIPLI